MRELPSAKLKWDRVHFPATWREAFGGNRDEVKLIRSFGYPDGIEPNDVIWLELNLNQDANIELNSSPVGNVTAGTVRIDVTSRLKSRNELSLDVAAPTTDELDKTILEAALLIESINP